MSSITWNSFNKKTRLWRVKSSKYLFSHKALAKVFRAKLMESLVDNKLQVPANCPEKWVVDCKNVGNGNKALIYLGKYLYKGVIQEHLNAIFNFTLTPFISVFCYRSACTSLSDLQADTADSVLSLPFTEMIERTFRS